MFTNYIKRKTISTYGWLRGFEEVIVNNTATSYVLDDSLFPNKVIIFDQNWVYLRTYAFSNAVYCGVRLKYVSGYFYITCYTTLYKTDSNFTLVSKYMNSSASYHSIYYDNTSTLLYVASALGNNVDVFDTNLTFKLSISLVGHASPRCINQFNGSLYVGLLSSEVIVIQNNTISSVINISSCSGIYSIYFDIYGNMATACSYTAVLSTYNGVSEGFSISTSSTEILTVDSQRRMIITGFNGIDIYY